MYQRLLEGETQGSLAREYGISVIQVGRIARGESRAKETGAYDNPVPQHELHVPRLDVDSFESRIAARLNKPPTGVSVRAIPPNPMFVKPVEEDTPNMSAMEKLVKEISDKRDRSNDQLGELDKGDSER
jgi:hypothetical protein